MMNLPTEALYLSLSLQVFHNMGMLYLPIHQQLQEVIHLYLSAHISQLPAENYAIKNGVHPRISTASNIANIKRQIQDISAIYDWDMEVNTTDPEFYKWTQWIFVKMFKAGLAYEKEMPINWCPSCKTGLANEEVVNGCCERCHSVVTKKDLKQWMLKITAYADRLLDDLDKLDWPEKVKKMQGDWIGRSYGAEVD